MTLYYIKYKSIFDELTNLKNELKELDIDKRHLDL